MDIDIRSAFHAVLINRSSNVVVVPSIEIDSMDVYIVQAEDGESGATLNLWACLGSQNDEEATTMLSTIQQSINRVIGQSPTTTTTKPDVSSSPSSVHHSNYDSNGSAFDSSTSKTARRADPIQPRYGLSYLYQE